MISYIEYTYLASTQIARSIALRGRGAKAALDGTQTSCSESWETSEKLVGVNDGAEGRAPKTEHKSSRHTSQNVVRAIT